MIKISGYTVSKPVTINQEEIEYLKYRLSSNGLNKGPARLKSRIQS